LLALPVAALAGIALVQLLTRRSAAGAALILGAMVVGYTNVPIPPLNVGGVSVWLYDVVIALIVAAAAARLLLLPRWSKGQVLMGLAGLVLLVSIVQGVGSFGLQSPVDEARRWLAFLSAALYFTTVEPSKAVVDRISRWMLWAGTAVAALAVLRWIAWPLGVSSGPLASATGTVRVIDSEQAFVVAHAFILLLPVWRAQGAPRLRLLAVALLGVVVLASHRTVWVAMVAGLAVLLWRDRRLARRFGLALVAALVVAGITVTTLLPDEGADDLGDRATNVQTFEWRVEGWRQLLATASDPGPDQIAIGLPFGTGWERRVYGHVRDETPHSMYLEALLRLGLVGLGALLAAYVVAVRQLLPRRRAEEPRPQLHGDVLLLLLVMQIMFNVAYFPPAISGIVLGLALRPQRQVAASPARAAVPSHPGP
jgi:O-antigen ligase